MPDEIPGGLGVESVVNNIKSGAGWAGGKEVEERHFDLRNHEPGDAIGVAGYRELQIQQKVAMVIEGWVKPQDRLGFLTTGQDLLAEENLWLRAGAYLTALRERAHQAYDRGGMEVRVVEYREFDPQGRNPKRTVLVLTRADFEREIETLEDLLGIGQALPGKVLSLERGDFVTAGPFVRRLRCGRAGARPEGEDPQIARVAFGTADESISRTAFDITFTSGGRVQDVIGRTNNNRIEVEAQSRSDPALRNRVELRKGQSAVQHDLDLSDPNLRIIVDGGDETETGGRRGYFLETQAQAGNYIKFQLK